MTQTIRHAKQLGAIVGFCAVTIVASWAVGSEVAMAERWPKDTVLYVRVADVAELGDRVKQLSIARALQDPEVAPLIQHVFTGTTGPALQKFRDEAGFGIDELLATIHGELSFGLVALPAFKPQPVLMFQARAVDQQADPLKLGEQLLVKQGFEQTVESIDDIEVKFLKNGEEEIIQMQLGSLRVVTTDRRVAEALVAVHVGRADALTLAEQPSFRTAHSRCAPDRSDAQIEWYVDPIATIRAAMRGNFSASVGLAILPAIGLDGLQALGGTVSMADDEYDMIIRAHLLMEPPRSGVLKMIALRQGSTQPEAWVPADVAAYNTWWIDTATVYGTLEEVFDSFRAEGALKQIVKTRLSDRLGVDFVEEILPAMTGRITHFVQFEKPVTTANQQLVVGVELTDPVAFTATLEKIAEKWSDQLERSNFGATVIYKTKLTGAAAVERFEADAGNRDDQSPREQRRRRRQRRQVQQWKNAQGGMAIVGNSLILTANAPVIEKLVMTQEGVEPRLRDELDFKLVASKLQRQSSTPPSSIRFERPEEGLRAMYSMLSSDDIRDEIFERRDENDFFRSLHQMLSENQLPPFEIISQYLAPGGAVVVNEETGLHYVAFGLRRTVE